MDPFLAALAGVLGAGGLLVGVRVAAPFLERAFRGYFSLRRTIESDRDRVVEGLRGEIADLDRRLKREERLRGEAEKRVDELELELAREREITDRILERLGTSRERVTREMGK